MPEPTPSQVSALTLLESGKKTDTSLLKRIMLDVGTTIAGFVSRYCTPQDIVDMATTLDSTKLSGNIDGSLIPALTSKANASDVATSLALKANVTDMTTALAAKADLVAGKVPSGQLPSYVSDIADFANLAAFPGTGAVNVIYIANDTEKTYRWTGSTYVAIGSADLPSFATDAQAAAGTDDTTLMTPAKVKYALQYVPLSWLSAPVANVSMGNKRINNLGTPAADNDAVNRYFAMYDLFCETSHHVWVTPFGNDSTALIGRPTTPFQTLGAALEAVRAYITADNRVTVHVDGDVGGDTTFTLTSDLANIVFTGTGFLTGTTTIVIPYYAGNQVSIDLGTVTFYTFNCIGAVAPNPSGTGQFYGNPSNSINVKISNGFIVSALQVLTQVGGDGEGDGNTTDDGNGNQIPNSNCYNAGDGGSIFAEIYRVRTDYLTIQAGSGGNPYTGQAPGSSASGGSGGQLTFSIAKCFVGHLTLTAGQPTNGVNGGSAGGVGFINDGSYISEVSAATPLGFTFASFSGDGQGRTGNDVLRAMLSKLYITSCYINTIKFGNCAFAASSGFGSSTATDMGGNSTGW